MKKTIMVSLIASSMLFGLDVTGLNVQEDSSVDTSSTLKNGANVSQAETNIGEYEGTTKVNNLEIIQTESGDPASGGNVITNSTITEAWVTQGLTDISDSIVDNITLESDSKISGTTISGFYTDVAQGSFIVNESNATGTVDATNVDITSTNSITDSTITDSTIKQSVTSLQSNAKVSGLDVMQTNTINKADITGSEVTQAYTKVTDATVIGLASTQTNRINKVDGVDANITGSSQIHQGDILIKKSDNGSLTTVTNLSQTNMNNDIDQIIIKNSAILTQSVTDIADSTVTNLTMTDMDNDFKNSTLDNSEFNQAKITIR